MYRVDKIYAVLALFSLQSIECSSNVTTQTKFKHIHRLNSLNEKTTNKMAIKSATSGCETWRYLWTSFDCRNSIIFISNVNNLRHGNITLMEYLFQWIRLINFVYRFQMGCVLFIFIHKANVIVCTTAQFWKSIRILTFK